MLVFMPEGVFRRGFQFALWVCVLVVAWLAFAPFAEPAGFSWDKANHVPAFCVMAALADGGYPALSVSVVCLGFAISQRTLQALWIYNAPRYARTPRVRHAKGSSSAGFRPQQDRETHHADSNTSGHRRGLRRTRLRS